MPIIKIIEQIEQTREIEIEFPYYYIQDIPLDDTSVVIHGKIAEDKHIAITITNQYRSSEKKYELEIEDMFTRNIQSYFSDQYKSNESRFIDAKQKMIDAINEI